MKVKMEGFQQQLEMHTHQKLDTRGGKDGYSTIKSEESASTSKHNDPFFILKMPSHLWST